MPCLLKARAGASPGVITFTHNEVLRGAIAQSQEVRDHLARTLLAEIWSVFKKYYACPQLSGKIARTVPMILVGKELRT